MVGLESLPILLHKFILIFLLVSAKIIILQTAVGMVHALGNFAILPIHFDVKFIRSVNPSVDGGSWFWQYALRGTGVEVVPVFKLVNIGKQDVGHGHRVGQLVYFESSLF